jgi:hypothetical protein
LVPRILDYTAYLALSATPAALDRETSEMEANNLVSDGCAQEAEIRENLDSQLLELQAILQRICPAGNVISVLKC